MSLFLVGKYKSLACAAVCLGLLALSQPLAASSPAGPAVWNLGGQNLNLFHPDGHVWVNKDAKLILKLLPARYNPLIGHFISLHRKPFTKADGLNKGAQARKPYNNYCGLVYLGPPDKVWTQAELTEMKKHLLPAETPPPQNRAIQEGEYLRRLMKYAVGYEISAERGRRYYERLQQAKVLENTTNSVVIQMPYRKPPKKDRYVTFSIFLVKGKLLGTVYYQNDPSLQELHQVKDLTIAWKGGLVAVNK